MEKLIQIRTDIATMTSEKGITLIPSYTFCTAAQEQAINPADDVSLCITYLGGAQCSHCGADMRKPFGQGYCYTCFTTLARCDLCIMSPDRCHLHLGTCREPQWGLDNCQQPHLVYLAVSSGPKVGITRAPRLHRRWVDQGASYARAIAAVPTRRAAGAVEVALKRHVSDRTDWRKMVSGRVTSVDLAELARQLRAITPDLGSISGDGLEDTERAQMSWLDEQENINIDYPVTAFPESRKIRVSADTGPVRDNLLGIKGGYVLLSSGVIPFSDLLNGDVSVEVKPRLQTSPQAPQMNLF